MVAAPITTGDTAFRSARLIIAQAFRLSQRKKINRIYICVPVFAVSLALLVWQIQNPDGFNTIWKYFGWANQTLAVFTLWTLTVYLAQEKKAYVINWLAEHGVTLDETRLDAMIEAAVYDLKKGLLPAGGDAQ